MSRKRVGVGVGIMLFGLCVLSLVLFRDPEVRIDGAERDEEQSADVSRASAPNAESPADGRASRSAVSERAVPADLNPGVRAVAEAHATGRFPERLTPSVLPAPFDLAAYESDPDAYLNTPEPGRVWQPAQPGSSVPRIIAAGPRYHEIAGGESVPLEVEVPPRMPVTFTSFDLGEFQNRLTTITVAANDGGAAVGRFTASSGTVNYVTILAASPVTSGQIQFVVNVLPPRGADAMQEAE